jgi:aryl-alcohol dehydrogenase-like predicted oxidoreductase
VLVLGTAALRTQYGVLADRSELHTQADAGALLSDAVGGGFGAIDTAPAYGDAERAIGESGCVLPVHTKLDGALTPDESLTRSLRRLRRDRVDVLAFHDPDALAPGREDVVRAAHALVGSRVGRLGASVYDAAAFAAAVRSPWITAVQAPVSVLDRRLPHELLAEAAASGVLVVARSVLFQGLLAAPIDVVRARAPRHEPFVAAFQDLARDAGRSSLDVAVAWVRDLAGVGGVVLGAQRRSEVRELGAAWTCPPLEPALRDALAELPPFPDHLADLRNPVGA